MSTRNDGKVRSTLVVGPQHVPGKAPYVCREGLSEDLAIASLGAVASTRISCVGA